MKGKPVKASFVWTLAIAVLVLCLSLGSSTAAASSVKKKYANKWVRKNGSWYHYDGKGKKQTGMVKIGKKTYLFDKKGKQLTGWRKVKSSYYYFYIGKKTAGSMAVRKRINGIRLNKKGKAVPGNEVEKRKLKLMVRYQQWADELTKPNMSKKKKLRTCFDYLRRELLYKAGHEYEDYAPYLDLSGAEYVIDNGRFFECYSIAAAFAYLANAIGYTDVRLCAHNLGGGHGWVEIGGIIYDPSLARHEPQSYRYFATKDRDGQEAPTEYVFDI